MQILFQKRMTALVSLQHRRRKPSRLRNTCKNQRLSRENGRREGQGGCGSITASLEVFHQRINQSRERVVFRHDVADEPMPRCGFGSDWADAGDQDAM